MNCNCSICSDLFSPSDDIYVTQCGHIFHYACLDRWIKRSQSCPQCRKENTKKSIRRIYLNFLNTDGITLNAAELQSKLDFVEFQLKQKEKDFSKCVEEKEQLQEVCKATENRLTTIENVLKDKNGIIEMLKERIEYMKTESKDLPRLRKEVSTLTENLNKLQCLQDIINSTPSDTESIVNKVTDPQTLNTYILVLKKAMMQTESKKKILQENVKSLKNEVQRLKVQNSEQSSEILALESNLKYLEDRNKAIETSQQSSSKRILISSVTNGLKVDHVRSPESVADTSLSDEKSHKMDTNESSSPYLCLKRCASGLAPLQMKLSQEEKIKKQPDLYILKNKKLFGKMGNVTDCNNFKGMVQKRKDLETAYNGFGGHSKLDIFPQMTKIQKKIGNNSAMKIKSKRFKSSDIQK